MYRDYMHDAGYHQHQEQRKMQYMPPRKESIIKGEFVHLAQSGQIFTQLSPVVTEFPPHLKAVVATSLHLIEQHPFQKVIQIEAYPVTLNIEYCDGRQAA